jgi:hypothetical protein
MSATVGSGATKNSCPEHRRAGVDCGRPLTDSRDWVFAAASGERLEMHIKFERGVGNRGNPAELKFYSARNPSFYQISRQDQVLDILRNVTTAPPDRVKEFSSILLP